MSQHDLLPVASVVRVASLAAPRARRGFFLRLALAALAILPLLSLVCLELCGARGDVGFLSGTRPAYGQWQLVSGGCYAISWFAATVVSPIILIGLGLEYGIQLVLRRYMTSR